MAYFTKNCELFIRNVLIIDSTNLLYLTPDDKQKDALEFLP